MREKSKFGAILATAALGLLALALLTPQAGAAQKAPALTSTPQYEAFNEFVAKMRDERRDAHTPAQKSTYERQLTAKHTAVVNRSNALFQRGKREAKAETQTRFKSASKKIRKAEAAELAELRAEYGDKLDAAATSFRGSVNSLQARFDRRYTTVQRQISELRKRKAKAKSLVRKDRIQGQINVLVQEVNNSRSQEREAMTKLKDRYAQKKRTIRAAQIADATEIKETRQEAVDSLRQRWNRGYETRLDNLRTRRTNQASSLEAKLAAGRAAIAAMPTAG